MKKTTILLGFTLLIISCSITKSVSDNVKNKTDTAIEKENDGSSYERAIIIEETNEIKGVNAEYEWLNKNYPGYVSKGQSLIFYKHKPYDVINIITPEGKEKSIYFNISHFYGKF
jgi:hypothetical protein